MLAASGVSPEQARILQDDNALHIRSGLAELERRWDAGRYRILDAALHENAALIEAFGHPQLAASRRVLLQDRVVALRARGHAKEAVAVFEALAANAPPPAYVYIAAGDAYMALRQPRIAREQYRKAIERGDEPGAEVALVYAHLEAEDFGAMQRTVDGLLAREPDSAAMRRLHAQTLRFSDRLAEASSEVKALLAEYPDDAGLYLDAAGVAAARGQPRTARRLYERVLAVDGSNLDARIGVAESRWAEGDHVTAQRLIAELVSLAPEHPGVRRLAKSWQSAGRALFTTEATFGRGSGRVSGNDDLTWDTWLYSPRLAPGVRIFAHRHLARARFSGEDVRHERDGLGVELTRSNWSAAAEIGAERTNAKDTSLALRGSWQPSDRWTLRALHETRTDDFPLKGRKKGSSSDGPTHLHADRSLVGAAFRWHESRRVAIDYSHYDFNDGNRRDALAASWFERLVSRPRQTLDLQLGLYTSRNSLADAYYFNPKRDYSASATLTGDAVLWRRYGRSFNHRLSATLGTYKQISDVKEGGEHDYGWKPYQDVRYELEWRLDDDLSARYGIGTRRFAYDGEYERKHYFYFMFNWRF